MIYRFTFTPWYLPPFSPNPSFTTPILISSPLWLEKPSPAILGDTMKDNIFFELQILFHPCISAFGIYLNLLICDGNTVGHAGGHVFVYPNFND
jgi:hypothetical protein